MAADGDLTTLLEAVTAVIQERHPDGESAQRMPPFGLNNEQLACVMTAAQPFDPAKRAVLLERIAGELRRLGLRHPSDDDVTRAIRLALRGLMHEPAA